MDAQILYAIFSTLFGGIQGAFCHLGEIRTLGMLRSRFKSVPKAFSRSLDPSSNQDDSEERKNIAKFFQLWNEFIYSMREEDLTSNRERDLLLLPYASSDVTVVQWPPFLLASKIPVALDMAKDFKKKDDEELFKKKADPYMHSAVVECYETIRDIINGLLEDDADIMIVRSICCKVEISIEKRNFLNEFRMSGLPSLSNKLEKFLKSLGKLTKTEEVGQYKSQIINVLQDAIEIITKDVMVNSHDIFVIAHSHSQDVQYGKKEQRFERINISITLNKSWREKKESTINVPTNLEARRRITFFANSLFMNMPSAPKVHYMLSFSIQHFDPYYREDVLYSEEELNDENEDGISIWFYLQKIYPGERTNFQERLKENEDVKDGKEELRKWVSYGAQTLSRTVRGMMYRRLALQLQYLLESSGDNAIFGGYRTWEPSEQEHGAFMDRAEALASLKFTYVISCQVYGTQKKSANARDHSCYTNILKLMITYPSLRGGYKLDEEIYRIKLPGPPTEIGEGKPENQNHAIIFTRGEAVQAIDMNQDNYFEETYKMRNVLEEFIKHRPNDRKPTILGLREHIFTGSVSSLAWFMSNQETSFVTIGQRILANPLR
ncbi:hypothetical protein SLA2020_014050 [Shorea laevis]